MFSNCYLAMTAAEFSHPEKLPPHPGWMACHFSPYGTGLSNCPEDIPKGTMLILNDRTPIQGHDPQTVLAQLEDLLARFEIDSILLDFQRPDNPQTEQLASVLCQKLSCPVGVSQQYAKELPNPVFLPSVPLDCTLKEHIAPWQGREIWLEVALEGLSLTLTKEGCVSAAIPYGALLCPYHTDDTLHCDYSTEVFEDKAVFTLMRSPQQLCIILQDAKALGITKSIGLYQQLGNINR